MLYNTKFLVEKKNMKVSSSQNAWLCDKKFRWKKFFQKILFSYFTYYGVVSFDFFPTSKIFTF